MMLTLPQLQKKEKRKWLNLWKGELVEINNIKKSPIDNIVILEN
jgi:argininosuccinate synthase